MFFVHIFMLGEFKKDGMHALGEFCICLSESFVITGICELGCVTWGNFSRTIQT